MAIQPALVWVKSLFAKTGGPYDETDEFRRAFANYWRSQGVDVPPENEYMWTYAQALEYWWLRQRGYTAEDAYEFAGGGVGSAAVGNYRAVWYADP